MITIIQAAIQKAAKGTPLGMREPAMAFIASYACDHLHFTGGDILEAWRATGDPIALLDWRNKWGAMMVIAKSENLIKKIGRSAPTTTQSHTATLTQWRSMVFKGAVPDPQETARSYLKDLKLQWYTQKMTVEDALWRAYTYGKESGL